jgi:hypothetical protein
MSLGGTKLPRSRPHSSSWASHSASATSVLRSGRFFTCLAFANSSSKLASSSSACQTGRQ